MTTATARAAETTTAGRARANREYVRVLLAIRQPELADLLHHLTAVCPHCGGLLNVPHNTREPAA